MASLTLTIGTLTASVSANNTKASNLLNAFADAIGATGTNQQKADAALAALVLHMQEQAKRQRTNTIMAQAAATAQAEIDALNWE